MKEQNERNYNEKTVPIFFSVDDAYAPYLAVAIASIVKNSSSERNYAIHVLANNINTKNRNRLLEIVKEYDNFSIDFTSVAERLTLFENKLHIRDYYTETTYYRFFIANMFPEYNKGIYLDCDIIVNTDVAKLYDWELGGALIGAVNDEVVSDIEIFAQYSERFLGIAREHYFNAGVLVLDLEHMRECRMEQALCTLMDYYKFPVAQDQDYLNLLCCENVCFLPVSWNKTAFPNCDKKQIPDLVHFKLSFKPWNYRGVSYEDLFWKYARATMYYDELIKNRNEYSAEKKERDAKQYQNLASLALSEIAKAENPEYVNALSYMKSGVGI